MKTGQEFLRICYSPALTRPKEADVATGLLEVVL